MSIEVLLIEDSPGDVRMTQAAFLEANPDINLHVAIDGIEALAFLKHEGKFSASPRPDFILLDLGLPKMDGREVLGHLKENPDLKTIPIVVLTASDTPTDIMESYQMNANCYLTKPVQLDDFENLVKSINEFWVGKAKLPQHNLTPGKSH